MITMLNAARPFSQETLLQIRKQKIWEDHQKGNETINEQVDEGGKHMKITKLLITNLITYETRGRRSCHPQCT